MVHRFALPDLGEGVAEGTLVEWLVKPGDAVAADQPIAEVSTDKVDVQIPSPVQGTVAALCVEAGELVPVGTVLAEIKTETVGAARVDTLLGIDLASLPEDPKEAEPPSRTGAAKARTSTVAGRSGRATIARRLIEAAAVPTVTNVVEAEFEAVRAAGAPLLTVFAHATVTALREHPQLNAWGKPNGSTEQRDEVNLGVATQAPSGLVVPVVHDAQSLAAEQLGTAIAEVTAAAREGRARPEDLRGSTFTITSAGRLAGLFATPLLNLPEVAILGLYSLQQRAVVRDGAVVPRWMANLSITFDHRALDGMVAAQFMARLVELIESWREEPG
jgi:pyruvate/2-oxoglutarate dehydrogenase complex dihydrolipoamide acyltransferase (E2) component